MARFYYLDKHGWPIEKFKGRPFYNLIRILFRCRRLTRELPAHIRPPYWYCYDCKNLKKYVEMEHRSRRERRGAICPGCETLMICSVSLGGRPYIDEERGARFGHKAVMKVLEDLKRQRQDPDMLGLEPTLYVWPPEVAQDYWKSVKPGESVNQWLLRRYDEGYSLVKGKWRKQPPAKRR